MASTWPLSAEPSPVTASLISLGEYSVTHDDPGRLGDPEGGADVHREQDALHGDLDRWMLGGERPDVALDRVQAIGHGVSRRRREHAEGHQPWLAPARVDDRVAASREAGVDPPNEHGFDPTVCGGRPRGRSPFRFCSTLTDRLPMEVPCR